MAEYTDEGTIPEEAEDANRWRQLYVYENGQFKPINTQRPGRKPVYPLHKMSVGYSFFIPNGANKPLKSIYERAKRLGIKVRQRVVVENGEQGVRVWRVK